MRTRCWIALAAAGALLLLGALYYVPLRFHSLMGDDLSPYVGLELARTAGFWRTTVASGYGGIFRPLDLIFVLGRAKLHTPDYDVFFFGNLLLASFTAWTLFLVLSRRTRSAALAFVLAASMLVHHYQYYLVLIRTGEVDLLPNLMFIGFLALLLIHFEQGRPLTHLAVALSYGALVYTRENYVFAAPSLVAAAFWPAQGQTLRRTLREPKAWAGAGLVIAITASYFMLRRILLGPSMTNVPGAALNFQVLPILRSYGIMFLDLFSVYLNEYHFVGIDSHQVAKPILALQGLFLAANAALAIAYARSRTISRRDKQIAAALVLLMLAMLVAPALIQKNDLRYIAPAYALYAVLVSTALVSLARGRLLQMGLAASFAAYVVTTSLYFRRHLDGLFYVEGTRIAESLKTLTIDRYGASLRDMDVFLPQHPDLDWPLQGDLFFRVYLGDIGVVTHRYRDLDEVELRGPGRLLVLGFDAPASTFYDITESVLDERRRKTHPTLDLAALLSEGTSGPHPAVSTSTGQGVLIGKVSGDAERTTSPILTVLSGFYFRSSHFLVEPGAELSLAYRVPLPTSQAAGLHLVALTNAGDTRLFDDVILKPELSWRRRRLDLRTFVGQQIQLDVAIDSPAGSAVGDGISFKNLSVSLPQPGTSPAPCAH